MPFYLGYNSGAGAGHTHGNPDLAGWKDAYQKIGPGSSGSNGAPFAQCVKLFDTSAGYPNFPATWSGSTGQLLAANNGGVALVPIFVFNNVPTAGQIASFLGTLPPGQKVAFNYQSEQEGGITASAFQAGCAQISASLNTALASMGGSSFWNRGNFPLVTASLMSYYAGGGDTAYLPPPTVIDSYGADFYQHFSSTATQNVGARNDPRFQNWLKNVIKVAGPTPSLSLTEYGLGMGTYSATFESQRAAILASDYNYLTGAAAPGSLLFWMYWYQMDASPDFYCFPLTSGETWAQAQLTISQWQSMITGGPVVPGGPLTVSLPRPAARLAGAPSTGALALLLPAPRTSLAGVPAVNSVTGTLAPRLPGPVAGLSAQPPVFTWMQNLGAPPFGNVAAVTITLAANTAQGNTVIIRGHSTAGNKIQQVTDSRGNTYGAAQASSASQATAEIWSAYIGTRLLAGDTITITWAAAKPQTQATADEFSGLASTGAADQGDEATSATTSVTVGPSGTTSQPNELAVTAAGGSNTGAWTYPASPWTALAAPGGTAPLQGAWQALNATQAVTATWADAGAVNMEAVVATFRARPAGGLSIHLPVPATTLAANVPHVDGALAAVLPGPRTSLSAQLPPSILGSLTLVLG